MSLRSMSAALITVRLRPGALGIGGTRVGLIVA